MKTFLGSIVTVAALLTLTACGGGGGGSSSPTATTAKTATGRYADGPVVGLGYSSGSQSNTTGADGSFVYEVGNTVKFFVGDVVIGETSAGAIITALHLVPGSDASTPQVVNIMRFLLSIGSVDQNTGVITISPEVFNAAKGKTLNFATATDDELLALVKLLTNNNNAVLVDAATATAKLAKVIYKEFGGTYSGTFTGSASSTTWELTIDRATGAVTGGGTDGALETISGSMKNGVFFSGEAIGGCVLNGKINLFTGELSGNWQYPPIASKIGTFSGTRSLQ